MLLSLRTKYGYLFGAFTLASVPERSTLFIVPQNVNLSCLCKNFNSSLSLQHNSIICHCI